MMKIEGSNNGVKWVLFAKKEDIAEARISAARCMMKTTYTYVRITEVKL